MDRFSTEAISASSTGAQREAMLRHNLLLTNAQFNEITISSMAFPEGGVNKGFFTSHFAYNNVTNALNAGIELVINDTGGIIYPMLEEINTGGKALAKISGRYSGALDMVPENHVSVIADNMILGTKKDFYSTSFKKIFKDLDKYALELGIDIGYTPDYMPNNWDRAKIGLMTAEEWKNKMLPLVNEKRMLSVSKDRGMTGNISEILMSAHESLATARLSTKIVGNTTQIVPSERTIYFKDGHSWLKAHEDFGRSTSVTEAVKRSLLATQNDIIRATVGASSNQQIEGIVASLMNAINTKAREAGYKVNYKTTTKLAQNITNALSTNSGMVVDGWFSRFRKIANNVAIKSMTSGAAVTAAVMDNLGNISTLGRLWGMGTTGVFSKTAENMSKLSKPELKKLMSIANYERTCLTNHIDRYINGVNKTPIKELGQSAKRLSSSAANIPRSLTNYVAERNETRVTLAFMSAVQDQSSVPYLRLRKSFRLFLQKYGIREAEWEAYKKLPSVMVDDMTKIKSAKFLMNNGHDSVLVKKFATAEVGATLFGAPRSTLLARMKGTYSDNTVVSFMSDFITPFYNIANNGYIGMGNYLGEMLHQRQYSDFAVSFGQLLLAGYATYAAKKLLKGEKPKQDGDALMKSVLYAGIAGSAGEALIENMVMGEIVSSGVNPILQTMLRTGKGAKKGSMYSAANTLTRSANPYANFSVTGALIQKYTTNLLFAVLDPDGYAKYSDRLQQRVDEEKTTALAAWVKKPPVEPLKPSRYRGRSSSRASASSTRRRASNVRRTGRR
ncbi:putative structural protein [Xenohaliotis phage pCXc-HC2016]|nr:putative structural protein [Xenohaliotis phage pCXc-HC2016]AQW89108.1 putative structural protein [Xenohaliotis phage pCXc-HR2015]